MGSNREPELHRQIMQSMQEKDTDELLEIWTTNNRREWSDETFEIVRDILRERLGSVPKQTPPSTEPPQLDKGREEAADDVDDGNEVFHNEKWVLRIASWANTTSWIALVAGVLGIINNVLVTMDVRSAITNFPTSRDFTFFLGVFGGAVSWFISFLLLKGLSQGLYLLLDIDWSTRPTAQHKGNCV